MTITDGVTNASYTKSWAFNIPQIVGGNTAYVGFTGGTGGLSASQKIETWTFTPTTQSSSQTATPSFSLPAGTYAGTQTVSLSDSTAGAKIFYTIDGTTPATSVGGSTAQYTAPLTVSSTRTIKAIATASGYSPSIVASATYTIQTQAAAPAFSPVAGSYTSAQTVSITTTTSGSSIYYTLDGTTPATRAGGSTVLYSSPITVASSKTIKAIATASGFSPSNVSTASYTISSSGGSINFGSGFVGGGMIFNGSAGLNSNRLRITDGGVNEAASAWYSSQLSVAAFSTDFNFQIIPGTSPMADGFAFVIQGNNTTALGPLGGALGYGDLTGNAAISIPNSVAVKFDLYGNSGESDNSTGLYLDGAAPTSPYVDLTSSGIDLHSGHVFSVHMAYDGNTLAMTLTDTVTAAVFTQSWPVNIASTIGSNSAYFGFTGGTGGYTAIQEIISWTCSSGGSAPAPAATPAFSPAGGTYTGAQSVTITDATSGAAIYYTTNGSAPTTASTRYTAPVSVASNLTLKAIATATGFSTSAVASATYTIQTPAATPTFSPAGGTYASAQSVTLSDSTPGATIYYTTNGTTPTTASTKYTGPVSVASSLTLKAIATATGFSTSAVGYAAYTIQTATATPTFSPAAGTYSTAQSVTISDSTPGATIYYTTNGTTPTTASTKYIGPVSVASSLTLKAIATATGFSTSAVASATYTIQTPAATPTFSPAGGTYASAQSVTLSDSTPGATIYYTTNGTTPTTASTKYTGPVSVSSSLTLKAIATATGYSTSAVASASYVIGTSLPVSFGSGFTSSAGLQFNGGSALSGTRLRITDGGTNEARSAFWTSPLNVQAFTTDFTFQQVAGTTPMADGFVFVLQNTGVTALGPMGGALGYGDLAGSASSSVTKSVAIKFDLYDNSGEGSNSTGLYSNGAAPTNPAIDLTNSGISLQSGNLMRAHIVYNGTNLTLTLSDTVTGATFSTTWPIDIPGTIGSNTAYAGFAGGTGGYTVVQDIINWTYSVGSAPAARTAVTYSTADLPAVSSGANLRTFVWSGFPDNKGTTLDATAAGNSATFTVNVAQPGIYGVAYTTKKYSTRGITQLAINGVNVGPATDQFSGSEAYAGFDVGNFNFATAGNYSFKFTVTGKNFSSSGYSLAWDDLILTPQ